jgi:hypothetical protein
MVDKLHLTENVLRSSFCTSETRERICQQYSDSSHEQFMHCFTFFLRLLEWTDVKKGRFQYMHKKI